MAKPLESAPPHGEISFAHRPYWTVQDTYILEAGLQNDVELPYTCRGGICGCVTPSPLRALHQPALTAYTSTRFFGCRACVSHCERVLYAHCMLTVSPACRACVGRVVQGEIDASDVSHPLL